MLNLRGVWLIVLGYAIMMASAIGCVFVRIVCLGGGEDVCRLYVAAPLGRLAFSLSGITVVLPPKLPGPNEGQQIVLFNHSSNWDNFLISALGLSRTRYFLSWPKTWKIIPMTITSLLLGTYYTPSQGDRAARVLCFQRAEASMRRSRCSVILSPEGVRTCTGELGPFNKGAFHLATNLKIPIVPLFFYYPHYMNPWATFVAHPGTITVDRLPTIDTSIWTLENLSGQIAAVHDLYVAHHRERHARDLWV